MNRAACPTCSCGYIILADKGELPQYQIVLSQVSGANTTGGVDWVVQFFREKGVTVLDDVGTGKPVLDGNLVGICRNVRIGAADIFASCRGANPNDPSIEYGC